MPMVGTITIPEGGAQNGIYIDAAPDTDVLSPFDGMVESVTTTDGVTDIVMIMDDGVKIKMSGLASADMVEVGQRLVTGEVLSTARKEPMLYQVEKNGKAIDPRNLNSQNPNINRENAKPPETEQEARKIATEQIPDPAMRAQAIASITKQNEQQQAYAKEQYLAVFNSVIDKNVAEINPVLFGKLSPKDQQFFLKEQRERNDLDFEVQLAQNPKILTPEWLKDNAPNMTKQTYVSLLKEMNSKDFKENQNQASFDAGVLDVELINNGLSDLVDSKNEDKKRQYLILSQSIKQAIYVEQKGRKPLDPNEKRDIIRKKLLDRATVTIGWDKPGVPVASMTAEQLRSAIYPVAGIDIPAQDYALIVQAAGVHKLSDQEIAQAYQQMKAKK